MSIMSSFGKLLSPNDPELVEKTLTRITEQDTWNDVFSTKLIELLDNIDQIKGEIRQRMRQADKRIEKAEFVTQAEGLLLEEAAKAEEISQKLAATNQTLDAVQREFLAAKSQYRGAEMVRADSKALLAEAEGRFNSTNALWLEAVALQKGATKIQGAATATYQESGERLEESSRAYVMATTTLHSANSGFRDALDHLKKAELAQQKALTDAQEARGHLEKATGLLNDARIMAAEAQSAAKDAKRQLQLAQKSEVEAARFSRVTARYATSAVALSWIAMGWIGWFMVRTGPLFWTVSLLSILVVAAEVFFVRGIEIEA